LDGLLDELARLREENHRLREEVQALRDEVARLKGHKARPKIGPSKLLQGDKNGGAGRRRRTRVVITRGEATRGR